MRAGLVRNPAPFDYAPPNSRGAPLRAGWVIEAGSTVVRRASWLAASSWTSG
jgi:hypothetical protein